jgi:hypothetical protein
LKPQPLLDFNTGGVRGEGFKRCMGVRYKNYKWLADARKSKGSGPSYLVGNTSVPTALYKFENGQHLELPCMEVSGRRRHTTVTQDAVKLLPTNSCMSSGHSVPHIPNMHVMHVWHEQESQSATQVLPICLLCLKPASVLHVNFSLKFMHIFM